MKARTKKSDVFSEQFKSAYRKGRQDAYELACADISLMVGCFEDTERLRKELIKYLKKINPEAVEYYLTEEKKDGLKDEL